MADFDVGFGNEYLTPYQELRESRNLGQRALEAQVAANPLAQRDAAMLAEVAAPVVAPVTTAVAPNPFIRPPAPLSTMPVDKQIAWQQYQAEAAGKQAALETSALNQQIARQQSEFEIEGRRQAAELAGQTGTLKAEDIANYPLQRAELARKFPIGVTTDQAKAAFEPYERIYANALALDKETRNRVAEAQRINQQNRLETARKQAAELGEDALARFFEREKADPEAAITGVMQEGTALRQKNLEAQLINSGMTPQEIAQKFQRPEGFMYPAAEAAAKVRTNPQQEVSRVGNSLTDLMQEKREAGRKWTPMQEDALQRTYELYNQTLDRAGVRGMPRTGPTTATPTPTPAGAKPAPSPRPSATPPPPPLNPAYPEGWRDGKRYVQKPDGKWYLSKVQ